MKTSDFSSFTNFSEFMDSQKAGHSPSKEAKLKQTIKLFEVGPRLKLKFSRYDQALDIKEDPDEEEEAQEGEERQGNEVYTQEDARQYEGMEEEGQ